MAEQLTLADESQEYRDFVEKFKPKKTTDDCYTPQNVYDAVLDWVVKEYGIDRDKVVRPFWPGGDYERHGYPERCTVVDNPPFSIVSKICHWYRDRGVRFFLFAPYITNFNIRDVAHVVTNASILYENGAVVSTSFVTNLEGCAVRSAPDLYRDISEANDANAKAAGKKQLPKYVYPNDVLTASAVGRYSKLGVQYRLEPSECVRVSALDSQVAVGKAVFGGGYLLSERAAAERAAAERAAAELENVTVWELSDRERAVQAMLGGE